MASLMEFLKFSLWINIIKVEKIIRLLVSGEQQNARVIKRLARHGAWLDTVSLEDFQNCLPKKRLRFLMVFQDIYFKEDRIDWLIVTACQPVLGYFMPRS